MNAVKKAVLVAGVLDLSTAPTSAIWRVLAQQLRLELGVLVEVARGPSARVALRPGVRNFARATSACAILDAVLRRGFRARHYPFMGFLYRAFILRSAGVVLAIGAHPALLRQAKRRGVPVVELAHAAGGGGELNRYRNLPRAELPDVYVVFDQIAFEVASEMIGGKIKVFRANTLFPWDHQQSFKRTGTGVRMVLLALQWGSYDPHGPPSKLAPNEVIPKVVKDAVEISDNSTTWVVRPHPRQLYDRQYQYQMKAIEAFASEFQNVKVDSLDAPLRQIIESFDVLLTVWSSSAVEAALRGVPSIFLDDRIVRNVSDDLAGRKISALLSSGFATSCHPTGRHLLDSIHASHRFETRDERFSTVSDIVRQIALRSD